MVNNKWITCFLISIALLTGCKKSVNEEVDSGTNNNEILNEHRQGERSMDTDLAKQSDVNQKDDDMPTALKESSIADRALARAYERAHDAAMKDAESAQDVVETFLVEFDRRKSSYKAHRAEVREFYETQLKSRSSFKNAYIYYLRAVNEYEHALGDFEKAEADARPWIDKALQSGDVNAIEAILLDIRMNAQAKAIEQLERLYEAKTSKTADDEYVLARQMEYAPYSETLANRRMELLKSASQKGNVEAKIMWANETLAQAEREPDASNSPNLWLSGWRALVELVDSGNGEATLEVARRLVMYKKYLDEEFEQEDFYPLNSRLFDKAHGSYDSFIEKQGGWNQAFDKFMSILQKNDIDASDFMDYQRSKSRLSSIDYHLYRVRQLANRKDVSACLYIENYFDNIIEEDGITAGGDDKSLQAKYKELGSLLVRCYEQLIEMGIDYSEESDETAAMALSRLYAAGKVPFVEQNVEKSRVYREYAAKNEN